VREKEKGSQAAQEVSADAEAVLGHWKQRAGLRKLLRVF
jgi:hypothetical protein